MKDLIENTDENFIAYMWEQLATETQSYFPEEMLRVMEILEKTKEELKIKEQLIEQLIEQSTL